MSTPHPCQTDDALQEGIKTLQALINNYQRFKEAASKELSKAAGYAENTIDLLANKLFWKPDDFNKSKGQVKGLLSKATCLDQFMKDHGEKKTKKTKKDKRKVFEKFLEKCLKVRDNLWICYAFKNFEKVAEALQRISVTSSIRSPLAEMTTSAKLNGKRSLRKTRWM